MARAQLHHAQSRYIWQGPSQDFLKGGRVALCQTDGTHQLFISTSTGCLTWVLVGLYYCRVKAQIV